MNLARFFTPSLAIILFAGASFDAAAQRARSQDYLQTVIDLSGVLGKAHAMRVACNGNSDQYWRRYMVSLLDLESPHNGGLRSSMINSFNSGFSIASADHEVCSNLSIADEKKYAEEGRRLSNELSTANIPGARLPEETQDQD